MMKIERNIFFGDDPEEVLKASKPITGLSTPTGPIGRTNPDTWKFCVTGDVEHDNPADVQEQLRNFQARVEQVRRMRCLERKTALETYLNGAKDL